MMSRLRRPARNASPFGSTETAVAQPRCGGIAQLGRRQTAPSRAGDLRHQRVAVRQADLDLAGALDDMMVREDESIRGKDDTRRCSSRALVLF